MSKISSSRLQCTPWLPTGRSSFSVFPDVKFRADGSATYMHALGLELDLSEKGLGTQSKRFALLVDDLKVKVTNNQI
uniref:Glutaredoxin-dependent peroxiredoxin n=1 Tax=Vitis vinifera TaxID=29760 RepID=F6HK17_VITVI